MVVKDFCASDGKGAKEDFCGSDWAKAVAAIRTNKTESAMRGFMFCVLLFSFSMQLRKSLWRTRFQQQLSSWPRFACHINLKSSNQ
jgi:hypothetical protein